MAKRRTKRTTKKKVAKKAAAGGIRVHELATELGVKSPAVLAVAGSLNIPVTSQLSKLTNAQADRIRKKGVPKSTGQATKKKATKKKATKKKATKKKATKGKTRKHTVRVSATQDVRGPGNPRLYSACLRFINDCPC